MRVTLLKECVLVLIGTYRSSAPLSCKAADNLAERRRTRRSEAEVRVLPFLGISGLFRGYSGDGQGLARR